MKVLVVDDEQRIRDVIKEYCAANNFITDEAASGIEALEKLNNNTYDINNVTHWPNSILGDCIYAITP